MKKDMRIAVDFCYNGFDTNGDSLIRKVLTLEECYSLIANLINDTEIDSLSFENPTCIKMFIFKKAERKKGEYIDNYGIIERHNKIIMYYEREPNETDKDVLLVESLDRKILEYAKKY